MKELFTTVIAFIKAAELVYPEAGKGKEKFDLVAGQILAFAPLIGLGIDLVERMMPLFKVFVDAAVSQLNKTGVFKTKGAVQ